MHHILKQLNFTTANSRSATPPSPIFDPSPSPRSRRDHAGYPMAMDEEDGLSFGYRLPKDVTDAVRRAFHKEQASGSGSGSGAEGEGGLGPFVYQAEGLTFAFVEHQEPARGMQEC